jgi:hypothetical protein
MIFMSSPYKTYENKISHDYYCQIVTHEVCDVYTCKTLK